MDQNGFNHIRTTLQSAGIEADLAPLPPADEPLVYVTIETDESVPAAQVLQALASAGLIHVKGPRNASLNNFPELEPIGVHPGSITLKDNNIF